MRQNDVTTEALSLAGVGTSAGRSDSSLDGVWAPLETIVTGRRQVRFGYISSKHVGTVLLQYRHLGMYSLNQRYTLQVRLSDLGTCDAAATWICCLR